MLVGGRELGGSAADEEVDQSASWVAPERIFAGVSGVGLLGVGVAQSCEDGRPWPDRNRPPLEYDLRLRNGRSMGEGAQGYRPGSPLLERMPYRNGFPLRRYRVHQWA